jgi:hypothetical protein
MPSLLELAVSAPVLQALQRLKGGVYAAEVPGLAPRTRRLIQRLEAAGHVERYQHSSRGSFLALTKAAAAEVPSPESRPRRSVTREHLDGLGLRTVPAFEVHQLPRPNGRRSSPVPRVYLKGLPPWDFEQTRPLDETVLALLLFDPRAAREVVLEHPRRDWAKLRERVHAEGLGGSARHFGIKKLIELRLPLRPRKPRKTRSDAVRRAKTEPVPGRRLR